MKTTEHGIITRKMEAIATYTKQRESWYASVKCNGTEILCPTVFDSYGRAIVKASQMLAAEIARQQEMGLL